MRKNNPAEPILMKCPHCGYKWYSKSKLEYVTCPNCHYRRKREDVVVKKGEKNG